MQSRINIKQYNLLSAIDQGFTRHSYEWRNWKHDKTEGSTRYETHPRSSRWLEIIDYFRPEHFGNEIGEPCSFAARKMGVLTRLEGQFRLVDGREQKQHTLSSPVQNHGKPYYNFIALFVGSTKLRNLAYCSSCYASFAFPPGTFVIVTLPARYLRDQMRCIMRKYRFDII